MKKIIVIALCFAFSILLTSCGEVSVSESSETAKPNSAIKWFDCLNGDEMVWDGVKEYNLEEFFRSYFSLEAGTIRGRNR